MKRTYLPPEQFDKVCRVCLSEYTPLISVAEISLTHNLKPNGKVENISLISVFERFCDVKVESSDKKPQKICEFCIDMACKAFNFFQLFIYSNNLLNRKLRRHALEKSKSTSSHLKAKNTPVIAGSSAIVERDTTEIDGFDDTTVQDDTENLDSAEVYEDTTVAQDTVVLDGTVGLDGTIYFEDQETANAEGDLDDTMIPEDAVVKSEISSEETFLRPSVEHIKIEIKNDESDRIPRKRRRLPISDLGFQLDQELDSLQKGALRMLMKVKNKHILKEPKIRRHRRSLGNIGFMNDIFNCRFCKITFHGIDKVMTHIDDEHESLMKCILCTVKFRDRTRIRYHVASHSPNSLICRPCLLVFETKEELDKHLELFDHTDLKKCPRCQKTYKTRYSLRQHMEAVHLQKNKFQCRHCGKLFRYRENMSRHERNTHGCKKYLCQICGKNFTTNYILKVHMQFVHKIQQGVKKYPIKKKPQNKEDNTPNEPKGPKYKCTYCNKVFNKPSLFYQHSEAHPEFDEYKCLLCDNVLKTKKAYDAHYDTHKTFKCRDEGCPRMFTSNKEALAHSYIHKKRYKCDTCSVPCGSKQALRDHMYTHTGEKPYICEECGQGFRQAQHLKTHVAVQHHGEGKPWQCKLCDKAFTFASALTIHMRSHTGHKPFSCLYCDKVFRDTTGRHKHIKKDHPEHMEEFLVYKEQYQEYEKLQIREKSPRSE